MKGNIAEAAVPQKAIMVLNEVQKIVCNVATSDFEKVDEILKVFVKNEIASGECHDFQGRENGGASETVH